MRSEQLSIPGGWQHLRLALISKGDDSYGSIAITAAMWRMCMCAACRVLRPWIGRVAHHTLAGGLPGKRADDVLDRLRAAVQAAEGPGAEPFAGISVELRKIFDKCNVDICIQVASGAIPTQLQSTPSISDLFLWLPAAHQCLVDTLTEFQKRQTFRLMTKTTSNSRCPSLLPVHILRTTACIELHTTASDQPR